jgi:hypothetical protein
MKKHTHKIGEFEHRRHPVLPPNQFLLRLGRSLAIALGVVGWSLFGGMCGYHYLEGQSWLDAFLNAAMILGGMGPVDPMKTDAGKIFAGSYALYSGLVVIAVAGVLLAPLVHRMLHKFHAESGSDKD